MPSSNEALRLRQIRSGDVTAFKAVYQEKYTHLVQEAYRMLRDKEESRDIVQKVFIQFWEKKETLFIQHTIGGYLRKMVINACLAHLRTVDRRAAILENFDQPVAQSLNGQEIIESKELQEQIHSEIKNLPDQCRKVFEMSRFESMTYQQIGQTLNISPKTVENHIGKALKRLRIALAAHLKMLFL